MRFHGFGLEDQCVVDQGASEAHLGARHAERLAEVALGKLELVGSKGIAERQIHEECRSLLPGELGRRLHGVEVRGHGRVRNCLAEPRQSPLENAPLAALALHISGRAP